jgi:hypothetical protein
VTGSDSEQIVFSEGGVSYRPGGAVHAVDLTAEINARHGATAYALCSAPVHVWPSLAFNPGAANVHDRCAQAIRGPTTG